MALPVGQRLEQSDYASNAGFVNLENDRYLLTLIMGFNDSVDTTYYFQLFDAEELPADGEVPLRVFIVDAKANFSYAPSQAGRAFALTLPSEGLWWAVSTTPDTLTHAAVARFWVTMEGREL